MKCGQNTRSVGGGTFPQKNQWHRSSAPLSIKTCWLTIVEKPIFSLEFVGLWFDEYNLTSIPWGNEAWYWFIILCRVGLFLWTGGWPAYSNHTDRRNLLHYRLYVWYLSRNSWFSRVYFICTPFSFIFWSRMHEFANLKSL